MIENIRWVNPSVEVGQSSTPIHIYEVYGNYVEGLEGDFWNILGYVGKDFAETKKDP